MIKFGAERPAETLYPSLYDEFEISKKPYWSSPRVQEKAMITARASAIFKLLRLGTRSNPQ
jgi:hypothetical protein